MFLTIYLTPNSIGVWFDRLLSYLLFQQFLEEFLKVGSEIGKVT